MKFITNLIEDYMAAQRTKRGTTKFINTTSVRNWNKYEVLDNVQ